MTTLVDVIVRGLPAPQGSKRHVGRGILVESSKHVKPWRDAVRTSVADAWDQGAHDGPLMLELTFWFPRPRGHYGTGKNTARLKPSAPSFPAGPPDVDKLIRSTMDGITAAGLWRDDARVVQVVGRKRYTGDDMPHPGARIVVWPVT